MFATISAPQATRLRIPSGDLHDVAATGINRHALTIGYLAKARLHRREIGSRKGDSKEEHRGTYNGHDNAEENDPTSTLTRAWHCCDRRGIDGGLRGWRVAQWTARRTQSNSSRFPFPRQSPARTVTFLRSGQGRVTGRRGRGLGRGIEASKARGTRGGNDLAILLPGNRGRRRRGCALLRFILPLRRTGPETWLVLSGHRDPIAISSHLGVPCEARQHREFQGAQACVHKRAQAANQPTADCEQEPARAGRWR